MTERLDDENPKARLTRPRKPQLTEREIRAALEAVNFRQAGETEDYVDDHGLELAAQKLRDLLAHVTREG